MENAIEPNFVTADSIIDEVLTDTYDDSGILREKCYRWLFRVWKQITQDFIMEIKRVILPVNPFTRTVQLPADYLDYITVGYVDCGNIRHLNINPNLAPANITDKRACVKCGHVDLCALSYETITEQVAIHSMPAGAPSPAYYNKTTNRMVSGEGYYIEEVTEPVVIYNEDGTVEQIKMQTSERKICQLEASACGCYAATNANISILLQNGCCHEVCCNSDNLPMGFSNSCMGTVMVFGVEGFIQLSPDSPLESVFLAYKSNGLTRAGKFYFPGDAEEALIAGTYFRMVEKKSNIPANEKERARKAFTTQLMHVQRRLSRQSLQDLINIFEQIPRVRRSK